MQYACIFNTSYTVKSNQLKQEIDVISLGIIIIVLNKISDVSFNVMKIYNNLMFSVTSTITLKKEWYYYKKNSVWYFKIPLPYLNKNKNNVWLVKKIKNINLKGYKTSSKYITFYFISIISQGSKFHHQFFCIIYVTYICTSYHHFFITYFFLLNETERIKKTK